MSLGEISLVASLSLRRSLEVGMWDVAVRLRAVGLVSNWNLRKAMEVAMLDGRMSLGEVELVSSLRLSLSLSLRRRLGEGWGRTWRELKTDTLDVLARVIATLEEARLKIVVAPAEIQGADCLKGEDGAAAAEVFVRTNRHDGLAAGDIRIYLKESGSLGIF
tara:strand:- start:1112 stop:1597 length:486 start_codon:yes stop_codon:yes gene_type:complete